VTATLVRLVVINPDKFVNPATAFVRLIREGMFVFPGPSRFGRGGKAGIDGGDVSGGGVPAGWACNAGPERARSRTVIKFFTFIPTGSRCPRFVMMLAAAANKKNALPNVVK